MEDHELDEILSEHLAIEAPDAERARAAREESTRRLAERPGATAPTRIGAAPKLGGAAVLIAALVGGWLVLGSRSKDATPGTTPAEAPTEAPTVAPVAPVDEFVPVDEPTVDEPASEGDRQPGDAMPTDAAPLVITLRLRAANGGGEASNMDYGRLAILAPASDLVLSGEVTPVDAQTATFTVGRVLHGTLAAGALQVAGGAPESACAGEVTWRPGTFVLFLRLVDGRYETVHGGSGVQPLPFRKALSEGDLARLLGGQGLAPERLVERVARLGPSGLLRLDELVRGLPGAALGADAEVVQAALVDALAARVAAARADRDDLVAIARHLQPRRVSPSRTVVDLIASLSLEDESIDDAAALRRLAVAAAPAGAAPTPEERPDGSAVEESGSGPVPARPRDEASTVVDHTGPRASRGRRFESAPAFRAASEMLEGGAPFFETFASRSWPVTEELRAITTVDGPAFAADTLEAVGLYSGVGVPLRETAYFRDRWREAREGEVGADVEMPAYLAARLEAFAKLTGYDSPLVVGLDPIAIELDVADPAYRDAVSGRLGATRRWDPARAAPTTSPEVIAGSIRAAVLFARQALSVDRREMLFGHERSLIGRDARDAFAALVLLETSIAKLETLRHELVYDFEKKKLTPRARLYTGRSGVRAFPPHFIGVLRPDRSDPDGVVRFEARGEAGGLVRSHLADSASALLAAVELWDVSRPGGELARFFGDERGGSTLFPGDTSSWAQDVILFEFERLADLHLHPRRFVLQTTGEPGKQPIGTLRVRDLALALRAFERVRSGIDEGAPGLLTRKREEAKRYVEKTASFLVSVQGEDGAFHDSYDVESAGIESTERSLAAQADAIRALVSARRVTGEDRFLAAAKRTLAYIEEHHWDARAGLYASASAPGSTDRWTFRLDDVISLLSALRALAVETGEVRVLFRWRSCFQAFKEAGIVHAETERGGEIVDDEPDGDGDGLFEPAVPAPGARHGVAPVFVEGLR